MNDLVRKLRKWATRWPSEVNTAALVTTAADRIKDLEALLNMNAGINAKLLCDLWEERQAHEKLKRDYHNLVGNASLDRSATPFYERRIEALEFALRDLLAVNGLSDFCPGTHSYAKSVLNHTIKKDRHP